RADEFENGVGDRLGCFLRKIVYGRLDHSTFIGTGKEGTVPQRGFRRRETAAVAMQHDSRHRNLRLCCQAPFDRFELRITVGVAETVTVGMDHDIDKCWMFERNGGASK